MAGSTHSLPSGNAVSPPAVREGFFWDGGDQSVISERKVNPPCLSLLHTPACIDHQPASPSSTSERYLRGANKDKEGGMDVQERAGPHKGMGSLPGRKESSH
jgi:hypothetical protein